VPSEQPSRRLCRVDSRLGDSDGRTAVQETLLGGQPSMRLCRADDRLEDSAGRTAV